MRFKNRYLLMELVWRDGKTASQFNEAALFGVVQKAMQLQFGDYGAAMATASLSGEKQADAGPMSVLAGGITLP
eukprot:jgi/Astpho2/703/e_gw1.00014.15.1_t